MKIRRFIPILLAIFALFALVSCTTEENPQETTQAAVTQDSDFVIENGIVVSGTVTLVRKGNDFEKVPLADLADIKNPIIFGDIDLSGQGLTELPQMSNVIMYGSFLCQNNNLKSLKGMPRQVSGRVDCSNNKIKSLRDF